MFVGCELNCPAHLRRMVCRGWDMDKLYSLSPYIIYNIYSVYMHDMYCSVRATLVHKLLYACRGWAIFYSFSAHNSANGKLRQQYVQGSSCNSCTYFVACVEGFLFDSLPSSVVIFRNNRTLIGSYITSTALGHGDAVKEICPLCMATPIPTTWYVLLRTTWYLRTW